MTNPPLQPLQPQTPTDQTPSPPPSSGYGIWLVKQSQGIGHRWHFRWAPGDEAALIGVVAEIARDSAAPFDWADAAVVCRHIAQPFARVKSA